MAYGTIAPFPKHQFFDNNGNPAAGYLLFTYLSGTTTKTPTYSDSELTTANTNPIVLDSAGRATIFLAAGTYKFLLAIPTETDPPSTSVWTVDGSPSVPSSNVDVDVTAIAGEDLAAAKFCYLSEGDGGRTAGRWYLADADLTYASSTAKALGFVVSTIASGSSGTIRVSGRMTELAGLTPGAVYYVSATAGEITTSISAVVNRRKVGVADSSSTLVVSHWVLTDESQVLETFLTGSGNVGSGEDILDTFTIPAETLIANEQAVWIVAAGTTANNADAKTLRLRAIEGANNNVICQLSASVSEAGRWLVGALIIRNAATTFLACAQAVCGASTAAVTSATAEVVNGTLTWANAVEIRVTGEATSNNDIVMTMGTITHQK